VVTVDSPASVTINGSSANVSNDSLLNITSYTANLSTSASNINVVYTDKNGVAYSNSVATPGDLWNTGVPATASLSSGFNFTVNTHTHFYSEELTVVLTTFNSVSEYYTTLSNNVSTQVISIPGNAFQSISAGGAQLKTCRSSHPNAQAPYPKGTSITVQSCTTSTSITLTP
jgi:hypothetical protein